MYCGGKHKYRVGGRDVFLEECSDLLAVRFQEPAHTDTREKVISRTTAGPLSMRFEIPMEKFTIYQLPFQSAAAPMSASEVGVEIGQDSRVVRTSTVFRFGPKRVVATDRVIVRPFQKDWSNIVTFKKWNCTVIGQFEEGYVLKIPEGQDPLYFVEMLNNLDWIVYAEPDLVSIEKHPRVQTEAEIHPLSAMSGDSYAISITEADKAWSLQEGDRNVIIAVLDDGVEVLHPDLAHTIVATYDALSDSPLYSINPWDGHGTACSGLIVANRAPRSVVKGIAAGCSLMPVRIALSQSRNGPWVTSASYIRRGIDWAVANGAAVLSNSWGTVPSQLIIDGFRKARAEGRGGKGCVVVVPAGNSGGSVEFPGTLDGVLTVSGTNEYDESKSFESRDGESWWGSNYGPEVDISAPSVHIRTTDISGSGGMAIGEYVDVFNGTSAAVPLVSGTAALIISSNNTLSEGDIRQIIRDNADKVGSYPYPDGRNDRMGYGRLNVKRAIVAAKVLPAPVESSGSGTVGRSGNVLRGVIRRAGFGSPKAAGYVLDCTGAASYLLKNYSNNSIGLVSEFERANLDYLNQFESKHVNAFFDFLEDTSTGAILWGVKLEPVRTGDYPAGGVLISQDPAPNEVKMGYIERTR